MGKLTNDLITRVANELHLEPALLKAVKLVESGGRDGFFINGDPQILFEGHVMFSELKKKFNLEVAKGEAEANPTLVYRNWTKAHYKGGIAEYSRLNEARKIDDECALKATSWGMFQIMGFNHKLCGCKTVWDFVEKVSTSHEQQLKLMFYFLNNSGSLKYLKEHDWKGFAKRYNGPRYFENAYDQKLMNAYYNYKQHENK